MIRKELATAIGLSVALSVTGCAPAEVASAPAKTDNVEEVQEEKDITAPKLTAKDKIEAVELGSEIKASEYVEVEDESDATVYFVAEDGDVLSLVIPKELDSDTTEIDYTIVAVDALGNRSDEIIVTIPVNMPKETAKGETQEKEDEVATTDYTIEPIDDVTYYTIQTCNVRSGPSTDYDVVRQLAPNEEIIVNGRVKAANGKNWCVIKTEDGSIQMVSGSLISTEKIATKKPSSNSGSTQPSSGNTGTVAPAPAPSDCSVADCDWGDCEGDCNISGLNDLGDASYCSGSYCAAAE